MRLHVLAFHDLTERPLPKDVQDEVPERIENVVIPRPRCYSLVPFLRSQPIIDIKDIIVVLVVEAIVMHRFARLGENASWVMRRFIAELGVADSVGVEDVGGKLP